MKLRRVGMIYAMNSKQRCLAAIRGESPDKVPVFPLLMFFVQDRFGVTYREFATNGRIMAEAQLNIRDKFNVDAITACSDAFRVSAGLGAEMVFPERKPPYAAKPLVKSAEDLRKLGKPDPCKAGSRMADRTNGTRIMAKTAGNECLVLGWVDKPFAEASLVCNVTEFMMMLMDKPELAHAVLDFLTEIVIAFSLAQLEAGAPMIGAGDAATSLIAPDQYSEFALPYEQRVVRAIHDAGGLVKLHICGNTTHLLHEIMKCGADLFNVDHLVDFKIACDAYGPAKVCFKGNLNPVAEMLQATPDECEKQCFERLRLARRTPLHAQSGV